MQEPNNARPVSTGNSANNNVLSAVGSECSPRGHLRGGGVELAMGAAGKGLNANRGRWGGVGGVVAVVQIKPGKPTKAAPHRHITVTAIHQPKQMLSNAGKSCWWNAVNRHGGYSGGLRTGRSRT